MLKRVIIFVVVKLIEAALVIAAMTFALMATAQAGTWTTGVHALSFHAHGGYEAVTPGLYARSPDGWTFGAYRNSQRGSSAYFGHTWERNGFALTLGAVTGYARADVLPMVVPSYRFKSGIRLSLIPNPFGASALHLSFER